MYLLLLSVDEAEEIFKSSGNYSPQFVCERVRIVLGGACVCRVCVCVRVCVSAYIRYVLVTDKPIIVKVLPEPVCPLQRRDRMQVSKSVRHYSSKTGFPALLANIPSRPHQYMDSTHTYSYSNRKNGENIATRPCISQEKLCPSLTTWNSVCRPPFTHLLCRQF